MFLVELRALTRMMWKATGRECERKERDEKKDFKIGLYITYFIVHSSYLSSTIIDSINCK